ncbi:hypothetical protein GS534_27335 [Rhodococcus hoagii]|nr:hypothetical protein [Prescottella equi]NKS33687.1 hypothetical protein [Prescottella equi]
MAWNGPGSLSCRAYAGGHSWKSGSKNMGSSEADLALVKKIQPVVTGVGTLIGGLGAILGLIGAVAALG